MQNNVINNIRKSGRSIYDPVEDSLFVPTEQLQQVLHSSLVGISLGTYALRTRSKIVKTEICRALGYPLPASFRKCHPRFPAQNFDTYTQKSLNVQIWNEPVDPSRRYVFICLNTDDVVTAVKVITGEQLAQYDRTGTLTHKYQASMKHFGTSRLFIDADTDNVKEWTTSNAQNLSGTLPTEKPLEGAMLPIDDIYRKLLPLVGTSINHVGAVQERNRGSELHAKICKQLGYKTYADDGQYPDIVHQLLEIKLQTSPTIDLGNHSPEDGETIVETSSKTFKSEDIRYAVFDGTAEGDTVHLDALYVVNGVNFSQAFPLFRGKVKNKKLQIPLPQDFFD